MRGGVAVVRKPVNERNKKLHYKSFALNYSLRVMVM